MTTITTSSSVTLMPASLLRFDFFFGGLITGLPMWTYHLLLDYELFSPGAGLLPRRAKTLWLSQERCHHRFLLKRLLSTGTARSELWLIATRGYSIGTLLPH